MVIVKRDNKNERSKENKHKEVDNQETDDGFHGIVNGSQIEVDFPEIDQQDGEERGLDVPEVDIRVWEELVRGHDNADEDERDQCKEAY